MTTFEKRVEDYIRANYDIPKEMAFYIGREEYDFEDWVEEYISEVNENVDYPFDDEADEYDVESIAEEILSIMTSNPPYQKVGNFTIGMEE